jgi:hypothetical protein
MIMGRKGPYLAKTTHDHGRRPECLNVKLRYNGQISLKFPPGRGGARCSTRRCTETGGWLAGNVGPGRDLVHRELFRFLYALPGVTAGRKLVGALLAVLQDSGGLGEVTDMREKLLDPTGASERGVDTTLAPRLRSLHGLTAGLLD